MLRITCVRRWNRKENIIRVITRLHFTSHIKYDTNSMEQISYWEENYPPLMGPKVRQSAQRTADNPVYPHTSFLWYMYNIVFPMKMLYSFLMAPCCATYTYLVVLEKFACRWCPNLCSKLLRDCQCNLLLSCKEFSTFPYLSNMVIKFVRLLTSEQVSF